jgi:NADH-quinone oxidoreductase subunit J
VIEEEKMTANLIIFIILAVVTIGSALAMLFSRNAVYAALFLILNFIAVALFYVMLDAPFIAISQVTVYAGAIMVLFLFVIMLLGAEQTGRTPSRWWYQPVALFLGMVLLVETAIIIFSQTSKLPAPVDVPASFGSPLAIGQELFTNYLLPFEATSILLLAALVGAIVLTRGEKK